jgi:hypothetical protein
VVCEEDACMSDARKGKNKKKPMNIFQRRESKKKITGYYALLFRIKRGKTVEKIQHNHNFVCYVLTQRMIEYAWHSEERKFR